jgi:hypothetical protein
MKAPDNSKEYSKLFYALKVVLVLLLMPYIACAQFAKINLYIPSQCGFNEINPIEFTTVKDQQSGLQKLNGTAVFSISADENLQIMLRLKTNDPETVEQLSGMSFNVFAGYRNDGFSGPLKTKPFNGTDAGFSLSNSGRIIENMVDHPVRLSAFLFLTLLGNLNPGMTGFDGNLDIQIEYN